MRARARHVWLLAAAAAVPAGVGACELIAGVHDVTYGGMGGGLDAGGDAAVGAGGDTAVGAGGDASACSPLSDAGEPASPLTPVPAGYGPYCSVMDPDSGAWGLYWWHDFATLPDGGLPCTTGLAATQRAGLHASDPVGNDAGGAVANDALARCWGQPPAVYAGPGSIPLTAASNDALDAGRSGCALTVAPVSLPIFSRPYAADVDPVPLGAFDFDLLHAPWDVASFGQMPSPPGTTACSVDRAGRERCHFGTAAECGDAGAGCMIPDPGATLGVSYAWGMPEGTPLLAVADGIVRGSRARSQPGCGVAQEEIYVEHAVGSSTPGAEVYTERFVVGYLGLSSREVSAGDVVTRGQEIGRSGSTGCPAVMALRFLVLRLTNLAGARAYAFALEPGGPYGFDGIQGAIDPFGWGAPEGVDPWGYRFVDAPAPAGSPCGYGGPGAFSIDLWLPGESPPTLP